MAAFDPTEDTCIEDTLSPESDDADVRTRLGRELATWYYYKVQLPNFATDLPNNELSPERLSELTRELEESLDDIMAMRAFIIGHHQAKREKSADAEVKIKVNVKEEVDTLKVVSWDVGMLCYKYLGRRAQAVADLILKGDFDIVFLQELNIYGWHYLRCRLDEGYVPSTGGTVGQVNNGSFQYFNATFVRRGTCDVVEDKVVFYKRTGERRSLLRTDVMLGNVKICLLNTHLETKRDNSDCRLQQLDKCFKICASLDGNCPVIFSGSLNIRDWEMTKLHVPRKLVDVWAVHGNCANEYTWDLSVNQLVQMPPPSENAYRIPGQLQPMKRFDRMYFRAAEVPLIKPCSFDLLGKEVVAAGKYCASDHWALASNFDVDKKCYEKDSGGQDQSDEKTDIFWNGDLLPGEDEENQEKYEPEVKDNWDDSD